MNHYLTYVYLLTALHTGSSSNEGNLMGIAREVHTDFPYLPASGIRGKTRAELTSICPNEVDIFFGQKIEDGKQPTEGEVWFADATLLLFPIASLSHHMIWITCPLWLERWNRWLKNSEVKNITRQCRSHLSKNKSAVVSFPAEQLYLQTALIEREHLLRIDFSHIFKALDSLIQTNDLMGEIKNKLVVINDEDCIALVETGLVREVRVALEKDSKTVKGGSFRSEEAIPPEAVLFLPWGMKIAKDTNVTKNIRQEIGKLFQDRLQFGGLESLGRGWTDLKTIEIKQVN
ncbi:type III-B CRISPR module RAMP protein Cmr4 [Nostoc sp. TCL26-01]|uniref:type III-B CRISPR module RAMP protein Cmr4 n=1 Tax=Nostoc sp. TCL26-01 TaxID=2576904 RepID=UPI0015BD2C70|nr:type III-B CRISPR module RAMP protein Cmr4 [Nostoc sp. TCL26-01]QLE57412.1 type III-B CRISPR module RAMP protein Cmr4 [Nostoc sp. TCL26-01]